MKRVEGVNNPGNSGQIKEAKVQMKIQGHPTDLDTMNHHRGLIEDVLIQNQKLNLDQGQKEIKTEEEGQGHIQGQGPEAGLIVDQDQGQGRDQEEGGKDQKYSLQ